MRTLRSRLTYANVISTLCLFMLLGGGAYAATQLPKNSVGAKQIKNGAITGKEIKKGAIDASKLTAGTIATLKGAAGPVGPQGIQGPQGLTNGGAYATIGVEEEEPTFVGSHAGFAAVEKPEASGIYCLTPTPGTNTDHPIASIDWAGSGGGKARFVEPLADGVVFACAAGQLEVRTFELFEEEEAWIPLPSNALAFTVFAPGT
jgi:hypothetical protein